MNRKQQAKRDGEAARIAAFENAVRRAGVTSADRLLLKLYTAEEAADLLGLKLQTIRNLTHRRELPCVKVGPRGVRYRAVDLLAWEERRSQPAST